MTKETEYDSTTDTLEHIRRVNGLLMECIRELSRRAEAHDQSKLEEPEKSEYDRLTPKLKESTYGSDEYKGFLKEMKEALEHHYAHNSHHPEHYEQGVEGMNLFDLLEMLMDWKAATERHDDGDIEKSIGINEPRFGYDHQLRKILTNTAEYMGWIEDEENGEDEG